MPLRLLAAAVAVVGLVVPALPAADAPPDRPNLILFLVDDLGYADIGPFGSTKNRTPNLDRMAKEGLKLTHFYACPVCTPSRAQFITGCLAKRVSLPNVLFPVAGVGLNPAENTLPELLKQQGYTTACVGKWHLGDQPGFLPTRHGFDHYFGLPYSNDMEPTIQKTRPPLPLLRDATVIETIDRPGQNDLTERYTQEAVRFIETSKDKPFFLYLPHTAVHFPIHPGKAFQGKSEHGPYSDWVEEVDASLGRVLDAVRASKLEGKTLVLFTSDNGGTRRGNNAPLRGFKGSTFEGGMREPTIAWWPGHVPAGKTCDAIAANIDVLPTFVNLAGGKLPEKPPIDGRDITALLLGKSQESPHEAYFYYKGNNLEAVRSGPWKLFVAGPEAVAGKLYNLKDDPGESKDVAAANPDVLLRLKALAGMMEADLGTGQKAGKGVRPPGRVEKPQPLLLKGK